MKLRSHLKEEWSRAKSEGGEMRGFDESDNFEIIMNDENWQIIFWEVSRYVSNGN